MWRIDIWVGKKWKQNRELGSFEEALEAIRGICEETSVVVRGVLKDSAPGQICGIISYPFRGTHWWTGSGGKA